MSDLRLFDYSASGNCYKVRLLLAQLDLPYERVPVDIFDADTLTDAFAKMNPFRSTPVLQIAPDRYLIESNAILVYLAEGSPYAGDGPVVYRNSNVGYLVGCQHFEAVRPHRFRLSRTTHRVIGY